VAGARLQKLLHQRLVLAGFHHRHGTNSKRETKSKDARARRPIEKTNKQKTVQNNIRDDKFEWMSSCESII
jgi:hypothetical protein